MHSVAALLMLQVLKLHAVTTMMKFRVIEHFVQVNITSFRLNQMYVSLYVCMYVCMYPILTQTTPTCHEVKCFRYHKHPQ
jgi:hypothetical protein